MAKAAARPGAPRTKKPRHTAAQKKAAARAREQAARSARTRGKGTTRPDTRLDRPADERPARPERDRPFRTRGERPAYERPDERGGQQRTTAHRSPERRRPRDTDGYAVRAHQAREETRSRPRGTDPRHAAQVAESSGFLALGLDRVLVQRLTELGITDPFPIQSATIPDALAGRDLLGRGQTGSGKTMAFGLPMIQRLAGGGRAQPHRPRALVLTPTRELAMQVLDALRPLLDAAGLRTQLVAGGMSYTPQLGALQRGVDVLVATPGRLIDLIEQGAADLSAVEVTVLDEADHMAQMGFLEAITAILDLTPARTQRLLFSATLDHGVDAVAQRYLSDPVTHSTQAATASVDTMEHHAFLVHPHHKRTMTAALTARPGRTIVFVRTKLGADRVALQLREAGVFAAALHGGLNQAARNRVLEAFRSGDLPVLVATDVAARGIHVDEVSLVLQVDPPADHKDYLHRAGRTARAGERGVVVTLALPHQKRMVSRLLEAAGVDAAPAAVSPEDAVVARTTGGGMPSGDPIPQARLDALLAPRRPGRRPAGRSGGRPGGRPPRRSGQRREGYRPERRAAG